MLTSGQLISTGYVKISWVDELLVWNSTDYGGIYKLNIQKQTIWKPGLVFASSPGSLIEEGTSYKPTWVKSDGIVTMFVAGNFKTACRVDTAHFPFDSHQSNYEMMPVEYDVSDVMLHSSINEIQFEDYVENGEWSITVSKCKEYVKDDNRSSISKSALLYMFTINRRPSFVMIHTLSPLFLLEIVNIVTCLVPVDSGERVSYSVTVFLAFIFLSDSMLEEIPRDSFRLSTLSVELLIVNIISTIGVLWSVYMVRLSKHKTINWKIPTFIKWIRNVWRSHTLHVKKGKELTKDSINDEKETNFIASECNSDKEEQVGSYMKVGDVIKLLDNIYFCLNLLLYPIMNITVTSLYVCLSKLRPCIYEYVVCFVSAFYIKNS